MFTYSFSQAYNSIHNITRKTQAAMQNGAVNPQLSYDFAYSYPAPGSAHPHGPPAIGPITITNDADGNQTNTLDTGTSDQSEYLYDEENRLSCANKGPQVPSPSCNAQGNTSFIYNHAGVRKVKTQSSPTIYPNQYYTDFGGGSGNQFKHIFIGSERILTKKARIAPDRQHWYYHADHLGSTAMVTNENDQLVDALHYFPFGEVWLEERPSSLPAGYFFTAKEFDPETGFYDFGARYLDPRFSKWMTADPAVGSYLPGAGAAVASQSPALANSWRGHPDLPGLGGVFYPRNLSMYAYAGNGPLNYIDPTGRQMWMSNYERGEYLRCKGMCHGYNFDPDKVRETTPEENALLMSATDLLTFGLTVGVRSVGSLLFREAVVTGETTATVTAKTVHAELAAARRASGDFDLVNTPLVDSHGVAIEVPKRVNLTTGTPSGSAVQVARPDAVRFENKLILDDKPLGRAIAKDRQEIIRFIEAYKRSRGELPSTIAIQRYNPATGQPVVTELYKPSDFLPPPQVPPSR
jgi:RHS repeat-associated protein